MTYQKVFSFSSDFCECTDLRLIEPRFPAVNYSKKRFGKELLGIECDSSNIISSSNIVRMIFSHAIVQ